LDYAELLQLQFEKLVVDCVSNPLTALIDVPNGGILNNDPLSHVQRAVIAEISNVTQALPEMQGNKGAQHAVWNRYANGAVHLRDQTHSREFEFHA
jgi:ketopantoate reductase